MGNPWKVLAVFKRISGEFSITNDFSKEIMMNYGAMISPGEIEVNDSNKQSFRLCSNNR